MSGSAAGAGAAAASADYDMPAADSTALGAASVPTSNSNSTPDVDGDDGDYSYGMPAADYNFATAANEEYSRAAGGPPLTVASPLISSLNHHHGIINRAVAEQRLRAAGTFRYLLREKSGGGDGTVVSYIASGTACKHSRITRSTDGSAYQLDNKPLTASLPQATMQDAVAAAVDVIASRVGAAVSPVGAPALGGATAQQRPTLLASANRGGGGRGGGGGGASRPLSSSSLSAAAGGRRSAASVKRVKSRAATLSRTNAVEGSFTVIFAGKKAGAKMSVIGSASTDAASGKLEIYEKKGAGTKGMPKLTIRGKNIISATMSKVKGNDAVVVADAQNRDTSQQAPRETTFLSDNGGMLADLLAFACRNVAGSSGVAIDESSL